MPPDYNEDKASLKMSFLQDMLEIENVRMIDIEVAFAEAKTEYIKIRGDQDDAT